MAAIISTAINYLAPICIMFSPFTSYGDQIMHIHKKRSSDGFSLDIPLIMLVASILKLFYWLTVRYSLTLLTQALFMIVVQIVLLHVSLENRSTKPVISHGRPFQEQVGFAGLKRPFNFWQWRSSAPYWRFLSYYLAVVAVSQVVIAPLFVKPDAPVGSETAFSSVQAMVALTIEAMLPVPQLIKNAQARSCAGFRPSVCFNWLVGDIMKIWWLFLQPDNSAPIAFKLCAIFQLCCDFGLVVQLFIWGTGPSSLVVSPSCDATPLQGLSGITTPLSANSSIYSPRQQSVLLSQSDSVPPSARIITTPPDDASDRPGLRLDEPPKLGMPLKNTVPIIQPISTSS